MISEVNIIKLYHLAARSPCKWFPKRIDSFCLFRWVQLLARYFWVRIFMFVVLFHSGCIYFMDRIARELE